MIIIEDRRKLVSDIRLQYRECEIVDVTSHSRSEYVKLSPYYPHGGIPIPWTNEVSESVEGVWQGLKVLDNHGTDSSKFRITTMKNFKRTTGRVIGHQQGLYSHKLIGLVDARKLIYIPTYLSMLRTKAWDLVKNLAILSLKSDLVLLDFNTCDDIEDISQSLSHASILRSVVLEEVGSGHLYR